MAAWRVVITDFDAPGEEHERAVFAESGLDVDLRRLAVRTPDDVIAAAADADALLVQFATIDARVLDALTRCKVISRYGIGLDMIDVAAARTRGIKVANVTDFCVDEVSTQTIGFVIDLDRRTFELVGHVRSGGWGTRPISVAPPRRLAGQTLGIVGLGRIGRVVAAKAAGLGLRVLGSDPNVDAATSPVPLVSLSDLLAASDYVSLHVPLLPATRGLIGRDELGAMKPSAYLINMARGAVVDTPALFQALVDGTIAGAALDVLENEPPDPDDPLLALPNVLITPHSSSWSAESAVELRRGAALNVVAVLRDQAQPLRG
jgi:D-3-phosphoglycerate dehydrogenase